ncbi:hypothetical protein J5N97_022321 [Dioscorea zingiberensis]|uniref:Cytochrome P450 n=1 Tax=Dioscorea zingiberensis TaxID=325984 RepID=A0A9D5CAR0_9LILI|nr:hypothetical protein J5N97_022321 [Dioscorea zingiberensis]
MPHGFLSPAVLLFQPFLLLLLIVKLVLSKRSSVRLPPSPWKLPFIGNLHQLGLLPHQSLDKLSKKHGPLMLLKLGQVPTLVVSSSQMAKEILKTHDLIFANRPFLRGADLLLYGCMDMGFAPYGEYWRQMRKICMANLLSMRRVQSFQTARDEEVAHLMDKIIQASSHPSEAMNMSQILNCFSNEVLCRAILGKFSKEGRYKILFEMSEEHNLLLGGFYLEDYFPSLRWLSSLLESNERAESNFIKWDYVLSQMIEEHTNRNEDKPNDDHDFVDILLSHQKDTNADISLTNRNIKALLKDMFVAGIDTTSIVLEWSMAELIKNQHVLKKVQDEVRQKAHGKRIVEMDDLNEMNYLKSIIKEVLRLHPPVPLLLPRESVENCQIEGYEISKKTRVLINYWSIARDSNVWEKPTDFLPERFLDTLINFRGQDYEFIPFGSGRRICPGMQFAISTIELALANLIYQFDWALPEGMGTEEIDLTEAPGLTMRMKKQLYLVPKPCF